MKKLVRSRSLYISITAVVIIGIVGMMVSVRNSNHVELVTTTVETGSVRQLVSVSGIAEARQTAALAFPVSGIVRTVAVKKGDVVSAGDLLLQLDTRALQADLTEAQAALSQAIANRNELLSGPTDSARNVTKETVSLRENTLQTITETEEQKVQNAYRTLLSSGLTAFSDDADEDAVPPVVSGTYTCQNEGVYELEMYNSGAESGYSYRLSGIETGTFVASTEQPVPLGTCGLRVQFDENSFYSNSRWNIEIPNQKSPLYTQNKNAYTLAVTQAQSAISVATQDLALARANAQNTNAPARSEEITRANAAITQAQARKNRVQSTIVDRELRAPFAGTITDIDVLPGETVTSAPVVTLLASSDFEITARVPEIDIGKLSVGQQVEMLFDAKGDEIITGTIDFISLKATEIDGVSYYEARIAPTTTPPWIRSGLNADIDIIIAEVPNALRVPKRFVKKVEDTQVVIRQKDEVLATTTVQIVLLGNDGFVAITGLNEGDTVVAP